MAVAINNLTVTFGNKDDLNLRLTNNFLITLHSAKLKNDTKYISELNKYMPDQLSVKEDCVRVEDLLYDKCVRCVKAHRQLGSRARNLYINKVRDLKVHFYETISVETLKVKKSVEDSRVALSNLTNNLAVSHREKLALTQENNTLKKKNQHFHEKTESAIALQKKACEENDRLTRVVSQLGLSPDNGVRPFEYKGKKLDDSSPTHRRTVLHKASQFAESALWFLSDFGLDADLLFVHDKNDINYKFSLADQKVQQVKMLYQGDGKRFYEHSANDKQKILRLVLTLDRYAMSNQLWQELCAEFPSLPKLHVITECREMVNSQLNPLKRVPGETPGVFTSFVEDLADYVRDKALNGGKKPSLLKIKLEGDGLKINRKTHWVIFSYVVLDERTDIQSFKYHSTLAVVKTDEDYFVLQESLSALLKEIHTVIDAGCITVDGETIKTQIFFGSDMKFMLLFMGLNSASGNYCCLWCPIHKDERYVVDESVKAVPLRTLHDLDKDADNIKNGCVKRTLLRIEPKYLVMDVLHAMMRIFDRLVSNLILEVKDLDAKLKFQNNPEAGKHERNLIETIKQCGVSFNIISSSGGSFEFTSITGFERKKLLVELPTKLQGQLHPESEQQVLSLWKNFCGLLKLYGPDETPSESLADGRQEVTKYELKNAIKKAGEWLNSFIDLGGVRKGYGLSSVTPYMHCFVRHAPYQRLWYGDLERFSCQGMEKKNDMAKTLHHKHSNKWDETREVMVMLKRMEAMKDFFRQPRPYRKLDGLYWDEGGINESRKRRRVAALDELPHPPVVKPSLDDMSAAELRVEIERMGKKTVVKDVKKLRVMLNTLKGS